MSEIKHTPGPWRVRPALDCSPRMDSRDGYTVERADPTAGKPFVVSTWSLPNARLIAAAPEMLEALRQMVVNAEGDKKEYRDCYKRAVAAIAKATGASS